MAQVKAKARSREPAKSNHSVLGLTDQEILDFYRKMVLTRTLDERIWTLNRQGKVPIVASSQGHEAAQMGSVLASLKDEDCFLFPYYRDLSLKIMAGLTPLEAMLSFMGKEGDPTAVEDSSPSREQT